MIKQINKIVFNNNLKLCVNCVYFTKYKPKKLCEFSNDTIQLSKCTKFGVKNIVSGEIEYEYASVIRNSNRLCGKLAKNFIQNENSVNIV